MTTTAQAMRSHAGSAFFERGFRPFFFGAGVWGAMALPIWLWMFATGSEVPAYVSGREWHIHEMLYGYLAAALTGFTLTAVPNWTGRMPVVGRPLAALFSVWILGRIAFFFSGAMPVFAAVIDSAFLVLLAGLIWREVLAGGNRRNIPVCVLVSLIALGNILFHVSRLTMLTIVDATFDERLTLLAISLLLMLIGGRIVPSFTRNWLMKQGIRDESRLPAPFGPFDRSTMAMTVVILFLWLFLPEWKLTAAAFAVLAIRHFIRLFRWRGWTTFAEPLVTILHVGYLWIPVWCSLMAISIAWPEALGYSTAIHALTAGAIVTMTLAVMTRASLGHSGRPLTADRITQLVYLLAILGAIARLMAPLSPMGYAPTVHLSGTLTALAFLVFAVHYAKVFFRPRLA